MPGQVLIMFMLCWGAGPIAGLIRGVALRLPIIKGLAPSVPLLLNVFFIILSLPYLVKRIRSYDVFLYLVIFVLYILNYILFPSNSTVLNENAYFFLVTSIPFYFIGLSWDIDKLLQYAAIFSLVAILSTATSLFLFEHVNELKGEAMTSSHKLMPHVLMTIWCVFTQRKFRWLHVIGSVTGILLLLIFANRMSLLSLITFTVSCLFFKSGKNEKYIKTKRIIGVLIIVLSFFFANYYIWLVENISSYFSTTTRLLHYIYSSEEGILDSNGRYYLWSKAIYYIQQNPGGVGLGGDRLLINTWSHNLFIELLFSFGWLFGTILSALIIWGIYAGFRYAKDSQQRFFLLLLVCSGFLKLQFSGSFLNEHYLFFMIGYCVALYRGRPFSTRSQSQPATPDYTTNIIKANSFSNLSGMNLSISKD